jgi:hypothetical protein
VQNNEIKSENEMYPLQKTNEKTKIEEDLETEIKRRTSIIS